MPIAGESGTEAQRDEQHEHRRKDEPCKIGFGAANVLGSFPRRNGGGGKQHSA